MYLMLTSKLSAMGQMELNIKSARTGHGF